MDYSGNGWVTSEGFKQAMLKLGIDVTAEELVTLQQRFAYQSNPGPTDGVKTPSVRALTTSMGSMEKVDWVAFLAFFAALVDRHWSGASGKQRPIEQVIIISHYSLLITHPLISHFSSHIFSHHL